MIALLLVFLGGVYVGALCMAVFGAGKCDDDLHQLRERAEGPWHPVVIDGGRARLPREVQG